MTLMPTAAARLYRGYQKDVTESVKVISWLGSLGQAIVGLIVDESDDSKVGLACRLICCGCSGRRGAYATLWPKLEYLPSGNRNMVFIRTSPPPGYNMDELMEMGKRSRRIWSPFGMLILKNKVS